MLAREHHTQPLPHLFSLSQLLTKLPPPLAGTEAPPYLCLQLVSGGEAALGQSALQIKYAHILCPVLGVGVGWRGVLHLPHRESSPWAGMACLQVGYRQLRFWDPEQFNSVLSSLFP